MKANTILRVFVVMILTASIRLPSAFATHLFSKAPDVSSHTPVTQPTYHSKKRLATDSRASAKPKAIERLRAPDIDTPININTADAKQLQQLPTIGPKRAEAIIKYRETLPLQRFESTEQLLDIAGISTRAYTGIRAYITI